jgi:hypothetical protein
MPNDSYVCVQHCLMHAHKHMLPQCDFDFMPVVESEYLTSSVASWPVMAFT